MGPPSAGATRARLARLEMENRALRAGLESFARSFETAADTAPRDDPAGLALRAAAHRMRAWLEVYDSARRVWDS